MSRNALLLIIIGVTAVVSLVMIGTRPGRPSQQTSEFPRFAPPPTPPATATYQGSVYDCAQVISSTSQGENFMPDGRRIYAVLLADCDY